MQRKRQLLSNRIDAIHQRGRNAHAAMHCLAPEAFQMHRLLLLLHDDDDNDDETKRKKEDVVERQRKLTTRASYTSPD